MGFSIKAKISETTYTYDRNSNRISETVTVDGTQNENLSYAYDSNNRLTEITDNLDASQNISYTYDNNGNRTSKTQGSDTSNYIYNAENQLVRVEENANTLASFAYDHQGMRIKKEGERGTEIYTYDDQSALYQTDSNGALQAKYTYGPNQLLSMSEPAGQAQYYLFDGLGSPITLTKASGEVAARYSYDAFGNKIQNTGNSANRFTFTGHEEDRETDLIYMKARYYDPDTGQFLSEDNFGGFPDKPPSLNKYLYAYANPIIYVDPDGNVVETVWDAANVGIGLKSFYDNYNEGNYLSAAVDAAGVVLDTGAMVTPLIPAGAGVAIKASRAADQGVDALKSMDKGTDALKQADKVGDLKQAENVSDAKIVKESEVKADTKIEGSGTKDDVEVASKDRGIKKNTKALPSLQVPNAGGKIVSDVTKQDEVFYRVFSGDSTRGRFLTKVPPTSQRGAVEGLALPSGNNADFIQQVLVPSGTRFQRSRALPAFGRRGGKEQFELLDEIPNENFGPGVPFK